MIFQVNLKTAPFYQNINIDCSDTVRFELTTIGATSIALTNSQFGVISKSYR